MRLLKLALAVALLSAALLLAAGPGVRFDVWGIRTGFTLIRYAAYGGLAAAGLGIIGLLVRVPPKMAIVGLVVLLVGAATAWVPWRWQQRARSVPPIHDITTDTENPPRFQEILPLRAEAPNPAEYGGPEVAAQQERAYPDIQPLTLPDGPRAAFQRALSAAREMGWEIVAADSLAGRIEATATTTWFGFKDDVVVRVTPRDGGSRIDVRSVSRVGRSDVGTNARRIREYLAHLEPEG